MEQRQTRITITETEDGYRIDVSGKNLRDALSCCCMPIFGGGMAIKSACCTSEAEGAAECCPPEVEEK